MSRQPSAATTVAAATVQQAAQRCVGQLFEQYRDLLVLLRLFITVRYELLPAEDRRFTKERGKATGTSHLIHDRTPVFTLFGTRGRQPEWNDRRASAHFRCIPLASKAFIASLSMLSRQFASVGFDLELIDRWDTAIAVPGRADRFRGMLHIRDAAVDRDAEGRLIVPKQDFVAACGVKSVSGFGSGYGNYPALVTLFAFAGRELEPQALAPLADQLECFVAATETLAGLEQFFSEQHHPHQED